MTEQRPSSHRTRLLRRGFIAIYWLVLPLSVLLTSGWALGTALAPFEWRNWLGPVGMLAFSGVVGWRLWLNRRATGLAGSLPARSRLLRVFVPLGLLSLVGFVVGAMGLASIIGGVTVLKEPGMTGQALVAAGLLTTMLGVALCWPFWSRLATKPAKCSATDAVDERV